MVGGNKKYLIKNPRVLSTNIISLLLEDNNQLVKNRILKVLGSISDQIFEKYYWMFYRRYQFLSEAINIICFPKNIHKYNFQIVQFMIKQFSNKLKEICRIY